MTPLAIISFARSHWKLIGIGLATLREHPDTKASHGRRRHWRS